MSGNIQEKVQSPCIGVCSMDNDSGYCYGCYRTIEEIKGWWDMSVPEQKELLSALETRPSETVSFDAD